MVLRFEFSAARVETPTPSPRNLLWGVVRGCGAAVLAIIFCSTLAAAATPTALQISEDTLQAATGSEADTEVEPYIAADPNDPSTIVAVFQEGRFPDGGSVDCGYATSHNGGQTWTAGDLPLLTIATGGVFERASDPVVAIGPDGSVYVVTIAFDSIRSAIAVQRSDDGGINFNAPVLAQDDNSSSIFNDKEWITVDTFPASPHYGRVYVAWDQNDPTGAPLLLRYSDDRGATWSAVKTVSSPTGATVGALPLVQPNGDLTIVYDDYSSIEREVAQTSHDGGATFGSAVIIGTFNGGTLPDIRSGGLPAAAVDVSTGDLYAAWQDRRFRTDGLRDIVLSRSANGGASWGALVRVNADATNSQLDHFTPAVGALGGVVHVTYRTRDVSAGLSPFVDMRDTGSVNHGASFGTESVLGSATDLRYAAYVTGSYCGSPPCAFLGDYMGIAAAPDAFHPVWCRAFSEPTSSAAQHQTAWSASVAGVASATPTATATATRPAPTATPTQTRTMSPVATATVTGTATATATATPTPFSISGHIGYYSNAASVGNVTVQLSGAVPGSAQSDSSGNYTLNNLSGGNWQIQPQKLGDSGNAISALDASFILQAVVGLRTMSADQDLACDVSGNGTLSALDASLILQYKVGLLAQLPVTQLCGSDWVFVPQPTPVANEVVTPPLMSSNGCQPGTVAFQPLASGAPNQDFRAILFGDCTGNWQPPTLRGRGASVPESTAVHLGEVRRRNGHVRVPLYVGAADGFLGLDAAIDYDSTRLRARSVHRVGAARGAVMAANIRQAGRVRVALAAATRLTEGAVLVLEFDVLDAQAPAGAVHVTDATLVVN